MSKRKAAALILAAGKGTRMKSDRPKVLHPLAGRPMIGHVLDTVAALSPSHALVVVGPGMEEVARSVTPMPCVVQPRQLGTADAVKTGLASLGAFAGDVLILYADTPLLTAETLERMLAERAGPQAPAIVVLGFRPGGGEYGRLITGPGGVLEAIVEHRDATPEQRAIPLCNSGVMVVDGAKLPELLAKVGNKNAKGEYYLTDIVGIARGAGLRCAYIEAGAEELLGINSRAELAQAESALQARLRRLAMEDGATLTDPASVFFSFDTKLGRDVTVGPNVMFGPGVTVEDGAEIRAFSHLDHAHVGRRAVIGPFARLRPGAEIGTDAHVGNFVEIKNSTLGQSAKANHLSYIGDAHIGPRANIGAGTITCNYDGYEKATTEIGAGAFIGSNTALVAPIRVGEGAIVGAGSVITRDVEPNALAVARAEQTNRPGWAAEFRAWKESAKRGAASVLAKTKAKVKAQGRKKG
ncbi:MAG: bifunctional UDP-N-acetylglucosamine diphosphorylase/glucosamine-1-phosphate N-acetyltransferase GlmU [Alphaproteobacteria bacterium]